MKNVYKISLRRVSNHEPLACEPIADVASVPLLALVHLTFATLTEQNRARPRRSTPAVHKICDTRRETANATLQRDNAH